MGARRLHDVRPLLLVVLGQVVDRVGIILSVGPGLGYVSRRRGLVLPVHFAEAEWYGLHEWDVTYNRAGQSTPFWVKVENNALAIVAVHRYGSCP